MSMVENAFMVMILDEVDEPVQEGLALAVDEVR
jgi:hypothetical protein